MNLTPPADSPAQLLPRYALTEVMDNQDFYDRPVDRLLRLFEQESFQELLDRRLWKLIKFWNLSIQLKQLREQLGRYIPDTDELVADIKAETYQAILNRNPNLPLRPGDATDYLLKIARNQLVSYLRALRRDAKKAGIRLVRDELDKPSGGEQMPSGAVRQLRDQSAADPVTEDLQRRALEFLDEAYRHCPPHMQEFKELIHGEHPDCFTEGHSGPMSGRDAAAYLKKKYGVVPGCSHARLSRLWFEIRLGLEKRFGFRPAFRKTPAKTKGQA
jgi:DNA-directed RNA polymerase specialized sigma24 family protein